MLGSSMATAGSAGTGAGQRPGPGAARGSRAAQATKGHFLLPRSPPHPFPTGLPAAHTTPNPALFPASTGRTGSLQSEPPPRFI